MQRQVETETLRRGEVGGGGGGKGNLREMQCRHEGQPLPMMFETCFYRLLTLRNVGKLTAQVSATFPPR